MAATPQTTAFCFFQKQHSSRSAFFHLSRPSFQRMVWSVRSSLDGANLNPRSSPSNGGDGRTRLIRAIQGLRTRVGTRIREIRKGFPVKLFFFLAGFYCATAFATVIGQTGDWDILSAALAVVVVEGIGALMYRSSWPLLNKIRSLITVFNYWKTGLSLGLFLDSFKYEVDDAFGLSSFFDTVFRFDGCSFFL